jgi:hypothetical protein
VTATGRIPHVPRPQRGSSVRAGFFRKDEFRYDTGRDAYVCPGGQLLTPIRHGRLCEHPVKAIVLRRRRTPRLAVTAPDHSDLLDFHQLFVSLSSPDKSPPKKFRPKIGRF